MMSDEEKFLQSATSKDYYECLQQLLPLDEDDFEDFPVNNIDDIYKDMIKGSTPALDDLWEGCWENSTADEFLKAIRSALDRK